MKLAFSGKMCSGKDTFGEYFKEYSITKDLIPVHLSFADGLKSEVKEIVTDIQNNISTEEFSKKYSVSEDTSKFTIQFIKEALNVDIDSFNKRTPELRKFLQYWGTEVRRKSKENYWVNKLGEELKKYDERHSIYITDCRFPNECEFLKSQGFTLVLLEISPATQKSRLFDRDGIKVTESSLNHPSETEVFKFKKFDIIICTDNFTDKDIPRVLKSALEGNFNIQVNHETIFLNSKFERIPSDISKIEVYYKVNSQVTKVVGNEVVPCTAKELENIHNKITVLKI